MTKEIEKSILQMLRDDVQMPKIISDLNVSERDVVMVRTKYRVVEKSESDYERSDFSKWMDGYLSKRINEDTRDRLRNAVVELEDKIIDLKEELAESEISLKVAIEMEREFLEDGAWVMTPQYIAKHPW